MKRFSQRLIIRPTAIVTVVAMRSCSTTTEGGDLGAAPKKQKANRPSIPTDLGAAPTPQAEAQKVQSDTTQDVMQQRLKDIASMDRDKLEELSKKFEEQQEQESRILQGDNVMQMDMSMKPRHQGGTRVFWKKVDVVKCPNHDGWYGVTLDGRRVKAFESTTNLMVPSEEFAYAIAKEFSYQKGHLNKLLMPMTDLASGSQHVSPQAIAPRLEYLMSFFPTDNLYYRAPPIAGFQDELIDPAMKFYERFFDIEVPRIVGLGSPSFSEMTTEKVRAQLKSMPLNQYQVVSLCIIAQFSASLMLPLALLNGAITLENALKINRAEEYHNIAQHGEIKGYHDIREADVVCKMAAAVNAWRMTRDVTPVQCSAMELAVAPQ